MSIEGGREGPTIRTGGGPGLLYQLKRAMRRHELKGVLNAVIKADGWFIRLGPPPRPPVYDTIPTQMACHTAPEFRACSWLMSLISGNKGK